MTQAIDMPHRSRVLLLAPVGRDAELARTVLDRAGIESRVSTQLDDLQQGLVNGAGAALIAEEAVIGRDIRELLDWIANQPSWSDFPFIVLLEPGASTENGSQERAALQRSGNLTLLERPVGTATL